MSEDIRWWAYLHKNGSVQVKRFFDFADLDEAERSPFVALVMAPFKAADRADAVRTAEAELLV